MGERSVTWQKNKEWSDRFLPEIKGILGLHLIGEPPQEEDAKRNTDLMVLRMEAVRIGCRVRRHEFLAKYLGEFTIRASVPSGNKTELAKIIEGWGNYFFYGFCDEAEKVLSAWTLLDLNAFRLWHSCRLVALGGKQPGNTKRNRDGSSGFYVFRWADMPDGAIIAASTALPVKSSMPTVVPPPPKPHPPAQDQQQNLFPVSGPHR